MRVAVVGATGRVGRNAVQALKRNGHVAVPISRSSGGVDVYTGSRLSGALHDVDALIDASSTRSQDEREIVDFFGTSTANLLAAERRTGVRHHVLLSIVGIEKGHVSTTRASGEQERLVTSGPIPWSVVRSTQFHDCVAAGRRRPAGRRHLRRLADGRRPRMMGTPRDPSLPVVPGFSPCTRGTLRACRLPSPQLG